MEIQTVGSSIGLLRRVFDSRESTAPRIETTPQKPRFTPAPLRSPFPRATPESKGLSSRMLAEFLCALKDDKNLDMHAVMVIKGGAVVAEADFGAYDHSVWHQTFSACKSVTGLAIGMLVDEGKLTLDDRVVKLLADKAPKLAQLTMKNLTVRHLLTMQSGVLFNEAGSVTETNWVHGFLESAFHGEPGARFNYNSMNTYMLSAIVRQVSGVTLSEYLRPRLWEPLEIDRVFWETCPMGIEKGGWGLYIRMEDFAKVGQLMMNGGLWNGRRLISEEWVREATSCSCVPPSSCGVYDYGYQIWVGRSKRSFLFNGMFAQNVLCWPDSDMMVLTNAGNDELFQQSSLYTTIHRFFNADFPEELPEDRHAQTELARVISSLRDRPQPRGLLHRRAPALPDECRLLTGRCWIADSERTAAVGLLPLMLQMVQNIYTRGLRRLSFTLADGQLRMNFDESDESHVLPVGFEAPLYTELDFHGEPHRVGVTGRFARDEDDRLVLILRVSFLETASSRHIRLYFSEDLSSVRCRMTETPGIPFIKRGVRQLLPDAQAHPTIHSLFSKVDGEYLRFKVKTSFEPELMLELSKADTARG